MIDTSTFTPGDWITAGALAGVVLALVASLVLRRRAARQDALLERIGRRLDPANSYDAARLDLTEVFQVPGIKQLDEDARRFEQYERERDERDRAFGQGRWE